MNKNILITGSSRGIGAAIARAAHKKGYKVIVHGRTDSDDLKAIHKELKNSEKVFFDISDEAGVKSAMGKLLGKVGNITALVNNAGLRANPMGGIDDLDTDKAIYEWKANVLGTLYVTQSVLPGMIKEGEGSVVNIASIKGITNLSTMSSLTYSAAKAGVISITKSLAKTYAEKGVRFNVVNPGYIETDQVNDWGSDAMEKIKSGTLLGRIGQPEEIANTVMFLVGKDSSYMTGTEILADGGYSLKGK